MRALIRPYPKVCILLSSYRWGRGDFLIRTEVEPNRRGELRSRSVDSIIWTMRTDYPRFSYLTMWTIVDFVIRDPRTTYGIFLSKPPTIRWFYYLTNLAKEILGASHDEPRTMISKMCRTHLAGIAAVRISTYGIVSESHRQGVGYLSPVICLSAALILRASSPLHPCALLRK